MSEESLIDPIPEPEEDAAIARSEFAAGHLEHAAFHIANALGADPNRPNWLETFDAIIAASSNPRTLFPFDPAGSSYCIGAAHAYILAKAGQYADAFDLLLQVIAARPDVAYMEWVIQWLRQPEARQALKTERTSHFLGWLNNKLPELLETNDKEQPTLARLFPFAQALMAVQPPNAMLLSMCASLLRRSGQIDEALTVAQELCRIAPGSTPYIVLAGVHREKGDFTQALRCFGQALQYDPNNVQIRLDIGDIHLQDLRDLEGAERAYAEAVTRAPQQPWAFPSLLYVRYLRTGQIQWQQQLDGYAATHADNKRAQMLAHQIRPYFGSFLPEPTDATINLFQQLGQKLQEGSLELPNPMTVGLSSMEAPSAILAAGLQLTVWGVRVAVRVQAATIQRPDPRRPRAAVDYLLWNYHGTDAVPAVNPPDPDTVARVGGIAAQPYDFPTWATWTKALGSQFGVARLPALLGLMVHPPLPPQGMPAWVWLQRLQIASALVIAHIDSGWMGSARRKALLSIARGPMDWTIGAAALALVLIAHEHRDAEPEISQLFGDLLRVRPTPGDVCYAHAVVVCLLRLPGLTPSERQRAIQWQKELHSPN
jgi:tetratricopeptide (TPR) repeat protein